MIIDKEKIEYWAIALLYTLPVIGSIVFMYSGGLHVMSYIVKVFILAGIAISAFVINLLLLSTIRIDDIDYEIGIYDYMFSLLVYVPYIAFVIFLS